MSRPSNWLPIDLTADEVDLARERGALRQRAAISRGFRPFGAGNTGQHIGGYLAEIAVAKYEHERVPDDWTYEGDRARGWDAAGWNVRSTAVPAPYKWLWRPGRENLGKWMFCATWEQPRIWLCGWLPYRSCVAVGTPGFWRGQECRWIFDQWLKPLDASEGVLAA